MDKNKIDTQTVYEMFEELNKKLDKQATDKPVEPAKPIQAQIDMTAIDTVTERLENVIEEVKKPNTVEHHHRYTISIASNWFFFSWVTLVIVILGLFWVIANQRQTISQYKENDLKYRYIKMQGQTNEKNIYWLERQFKYNDSIKIVRKQVEKYEELVKEQAEKIERAKQENEAIKRLQKEVKTIKIQK
ncbi:MAG: hypothetical protein LBS55_12575 [Prevotellaceae bacterium]|jgi:hypothetical protein|nr:hypothetical protein [Prevotellaceae bacterium]